MADVHYKSCPSDQRKDLFACVEEFKGIDNLPRNASVLKPGGVGPESTVDYYQRLIKLYPKNISGDDYPEIIINSINMAVILKLVSDKDWDLASNRGNRQLEL